MQEKGAWQKERERLRGEREGDGEREWGCGGRERELMEKEGEHGEDESIGWGGEGREWVKIKSGGKEGEILKGKEESMREERGRGKNNKK